MTIQNLFSINFFSILSFHLSQKELFIYKARNSGLCMGNMKSSIYIRWVSKSKNHYLNGSYYYTWYIEPVVNNLHNLDNANKRLPSRYLAVFLTIPPYYWTQTRERTNSAWWIEPIVKCKHKPPFSRLGLLRAAYFFHIQYYASYYEWGFSSTHNLGL